MLTPHQPHQKIDLDREYPCPCLKGRLQSITLTEAFGCDRCHRIFVIQADGYAIEELAAIYPYKRRYSWDGSRWQRLSAFPVGTWGLPRNSHWWIQLGVVAIAVGALRVFYPAIAANPIVNLVLSMAIAICLFIVIIFWLFNQS